MCAYYLFLYKSHFCNSDVQLFTVLAQRVAQGTMTSPLLVHKLCASLPYGAKFLRSIILTVFAA